MLVNTNSNFESALIGGMKIMDLICKFVVSINGLHILLMGAETFWKLTESQIIYKEKKSAIY